MSFKKSSACGFGGCIEVDTNYIAGPAGFKSGAMPKAGVGGFSNGVNDSEEKVAIRDSNNPDFILVFTQEDWQLHIIGVKNCEFDLLK